uniref:phage tail-collar fiber domain-containing protein n=1 Tax=Megasphaera sp. TaxID=2023260 RepID=UPI00307708C9
MAQFPDMTPTTNGDKMLIQAVNGHKLVFTRGAFGSGTLADNDDIKTFTALKNEKMSLPIVDTVLSDTGEKITLIFNCSNSSLDTGFINREIGIFAKLDDGNEVLYSYSNAGMAYDYIPSKETPTNENTFEVEVYISSEAEINVTIDGSIVYLTKAQVEEKFNNHDKTTTAHAQAFAAHNDDSTAHSKLFGLCEKIANLGDDIIKKMALTTAITAISALTTDSWFGQLLKMVLTASGVRYLAAQNGYICFGSFFGNIIIQWG